MNSSSTFKHFQKKYSLSIISEEIFDIMLSRKCSSPVWPCLASAHRCEGSCEGLAQCAEVLAQSPVIVKVMRRVMIMRKMMMTLRRRTMMIMNKRMVHLLQCALLVRRSPCPARC